MSIKSLGCIIPIKYSNIGISYAQFGYSLYKEEKIGISVAKKLGSNIYAGIQLDYFSQFISDKSQKSNSFTGEGSLIAFLSEKISLGFHVFNPFIKNVNEAYLKNIPTIFNIGACYTIPGKFSLNFEVVKWLNHSLRIKCFSVFPLRP